MVRRRRWQRPFECRPALPRFRRRFFAAAYAFDDDVQEHQVRQAEAERADRHDHVPVGELLRVIGNAARHSGETQEVHREERDVEEDERQPEMDLGELLVVHVARPLRDPIVDPPEEREQRARDHHIVEMRDDVIGILELDVDRLNGQHEAGKAPHGKQEQKPDREEHRRLE